MKGNNFKKKHNFNVKNVKRKKKKKKKKKSEKKLFIG